MNIEIDERIYRNLLKAAKELAEAAQSWSDDIPIDRELYACHQAIDQAELRGPLVRS